MSSPEDLMYRRANFATRLPAGRLYSPSHAWLAPDTRSGRRRWRVGFTKFALRMLGELVELQFQKKPGDPVELGDVLGSVEGFKALSDIYCVGEGAFVGGNPTLTAGLRCVDRDPYETGWVYEFDGEPDRRSLDVNGYRAFLDDTIDRLLARQKQEEQAL